MADDVDVDDGCDGDGPGDVGDDGDNDDDDDDNDDDDNGGDGDDDDGDDDDDSDDAGDQEEKEAEEDEDDYTQHQQDAENARGSPSCLLPSSFSVLSVHARSSTPAPLGDTFGSLGVILEFPLVVFSSALFGAFLTIFRLSEESLGPP